MVNDFMRTFLLHISVLFILLQDLANSKCKFKNTYHQKLTLIIKMIILSFLQRLELNIKYKQK